MIKCLHKDGITQVWIQYGTYADVCWLRDDWTIDKIEELVGRMDRQLKRIAKA